MNFEGQNSINGQPGRESSAALTGLYQEILVDHAKRPRCKGHPGFCLFCQEGKNPSCGDEITLFCQVDTEKNALPPLISVMFEGSGCAISQASASMMCEMLQKKSVAEARKVIRRAESIYTGKQSPANSDDVEEDIEALGGVGRFPVRIKCAALAWKSLEVLIERHFDEEGRLKVDEATCKDCTEKTCRLKIITD